MLRSLDEKSADQNEGEGSQRPWRELQVRGDPELGGEDRTSSPMVLGVRGAEDSATKV